MNATPKSADSPDIVTTDDVPWFRRTAMLAFSGGLLWWLALPPVSAWPLAWLAPVPWLLLVRQKRLLGKRPYATLWLAGFVFWLAAVHWIRLPHPALIIGWLALAFYLGVYVPIFIGLCRVAMHQLKISVLIAAPVVWLGLELAKAHFLSGFTMGSLGHTQVHWLEIIQIADVVGSHGVSALIVFVAACAARMVAWEQSRWRAWPIVPLAVVFVPIVAYGIFYTDVVPKPIQSIDPTPPRIALIQGSFDVEVKHTPGMEELIIASYTELSRMAVREAAARNETLDLIVWPETMYRYPFVEFADDAPDPEQNGVRYPKELVAKNRRELLKALQAELGVPLFLGIDRIRVLKEGNEHQNSAIYISKEGEVVGHYDKVHLVAFGEYVPMADWFPWLYKLTPLPFGVRRGEGPKAFSLNGVRFAPNICYETTIPHLIREQVAQLRQEGQEPDILVNVTNDGWFRGSSELEMHLACGVMRAVECRKPLVIAANTGTSAWISHTGEVIKKGKRRQSETNREDDVIIAQPEIVRIKSDYLMIGDWPAGICLLACGLLAVVGWRNRLSGSAGPG